MGTANIFSFSKILIPINAPGHWTLVVISTITKTVQYYDSCGGRGDKYLENIRR